MKINLLDRTKKKKFLAELDYLGELKMNELFMRTGSEMIRVYSGGLTNEEIMEIWSLFPVEALGLYFGKLFVNRNGKKEARISLDGLHLIKDFIKKNVVVLNSEEAGKWWRGEDVEFSEDSLSFKYPLSSLAEKTHPNPPISATPQEDSETQTLNLIEDGSFVAVSNGEDFIGTGKLSNGILYNYLPKERRVRDK